MRERFPCREPSMKNCCVVYGWNGEEYPKLSISIHNCIKEGTYKISCNEKEDEDAWCIPVPLLNDVKDEI